MEILNVITVKEGTVERVESFPVVDKKEAQKRFIEMGCEDIDACLEDGYYMNNSSVNLTYSNF